jgi:hypothetical protein
MLVWLSRLTEEKEWGLVSTVRTPLNHLLIAVLWAGAVLSGFGVRPLYAQMVWSGAGGNNNTSTAGNWSGGTPTKTNNSNLTFAGSTRLTPVFDGGGWAVKSIAFGSGAGAFTLSGGDLTIGSGGITINSTNTQTINNQVVLGAAQTWNAASGNIVFGGYVGGNGQNLTLSGSHNQTFNNQLNNVGILNAAGSGIVTFNNAIGANTINLSGSGTTNFSSSSELNGGGGGINVTGSGAVNLTGKINSGGITLNGSGTTTLGGSASKSTGAVVVNSGTLVLNQTGGGDAINNTLTVNNGGKVVMGADNQVPAWQTVTLNQGSVLTLNDTTQNFAALNITGNTTIDFGSGGSTLNVSYGGINIANNVTITIANWDSSTDVFAGQQPGNNAVVQVQYVDSSGDIYASGTWGNGFITPTTPVPEPSTYGLIFAGAAVGFVIWRRRHVTREDRKRGPVAEIDIHVFPEDGRVDTL